MAAREAQRLFDRLIEMALDALLPDPPAQEIGPQELAERGGALGETAGAPQRAGQRAKRVVNQNLYRFWDSPVTLPPALVVERVHPAAIVEKDPERVRIKPAQIGHVRGQNVRHLFFVEGAGEMMVVDDVGAGLGPWRHRDHVIAEESRGVAS